MGGSISGTAVDPTGATISSATVVLTQTGTGATQSVQSQATGLFVFPALTPTEYSLSVSAKGFQKYEQPSITLQADQSLTLKVVMQPVVIGVLPLPNKEYRCRCSIIR